MIKKQQWPIWIIIACTVLVAVFLFESKEQKNSGTTIFFGGGPQGSTAHNIAEELTKILNRQNTLLTFRSKQSAGSFENLQGIEKGRLQFALANAEDGYNQIKNSSIDKSKQQSVLLVRLFGSYVQLIVPKSSPVKTPEDLIHKRVAIGSSGSDSSSCAKRYFKALGLWHQITPIYVGYERALQELIDGSVEAVWFMSGFPNETIREFNRNYPLRLVNLWDGIPTSDTSKKFYQDFPFYEISVLRPNVYRGQNDLIFTIGMPTLWFADKDLSDELVYETLTTIFSQETLEHIRSTYPATQEMGLINTLTKMPLPMHPAAVKFLREHL